MAIVTSESPLSERIEQCGKALGWAIGRGDKHEILFAAHKLRNYADEAISIAQAWEPPSELELELKTAVGARAKRIRRIIEAEKE